MYMGKPEVRTEGPDVGRCHLLSISFLASLSLSLISLSFLSLALPIYTLLPSVVDVSWALILFSSPHLIYNFCSHRFFIFSSSIRHHHQPYQHHHHHHHHIYQRRYLGRTLKRMRK